MLNNNDNASYVKIPYKVGDSYLEFKFLIDTGASLSLIKTDKLKLTKLFYDSSEIVTLNGLSPNCPINTAGSVILDPSIHDKSFKIKFHIVEHQNNIPFDGLIGNDFLKEEEAQIDLNKLELRIKSLPFPLKIWLNSNPEDNPVFILKPRSETVVRAKILNPEIKEGICPEIHIYDGVYLAKSIVKVENNTALTTILNTTNQSIKISKLNLVLEKFNEKTSTILNLSSENDKSLPHRLKTLRNNLRLDHLNEEEKKSITDLCEEYNDIFHLPGDPLTCTEVLQHEIRVTDPRPITTKIYRYPKIHEKEVDKQMSEMLKQGIISPSTSPYNSPLWVVPKKSDASGEKKWRVVIDFRKLNDVTVGDSYPLPSIEYILDQLGHSSYFTTLDLSSGFWQVKMKPDDIPKTSFSTPTGHYEFNRMPFGLKNSPSTFQRLMNIVLCGLQGLHCFVYLDDIVIYASSLEEHTMKLKSVFSRLRLNNLKLQPDKCEFLHREIAYLGHVITEKGVKANPEKIRSIKDYPKPKDEKQIKQFLGLLGYYRRFIKDFAKHAKPLTQLLKKDVKFHWDESQETAFNHFKSILTTEPILQYPNWKEPFVLTTDASNFAIGAILSQGPVGKDLPIAYASRTLNKAETSYSTSEKELLAIVWAVKHFRPYLYGQKFKIVCDHRPLTWLFNCKDASSRLVRWRLKLEEYDYEIVFKPGRINSNADALSRNPVMLTLDTDEKYEDFIRFHYENQEAVQIPEVKGNIFSKFPNALLFSKDLSEENPDFENLSLVHDIQSLCDFNLYDILPLINKKLETTLLMISHLNHYDKPTYKDVFYSLKNLRTLLKKKTIKELYLKNPVRYNPTFKSDMIAEMIHFIFKETKITITLVNKSKITPQSQKEINEILKENHSTSVSGHSGFKRTYRRIKENYTWKNMKRDIRNFVKSCESCQKNKTNRHPTKAPMEITTTSSKPFERLALDIVGPLPLTESGNRFILTFQDDLTKFSQARPIVNHEALTIAEELYNFIMIFGIPKSILTDNSTDFTSNIIKELNKLFKIRHVTSSVYHPQTNGALERSHSTLKDYLKNFINKEQNNWDIYVPSAMFCYNTSIHSSTHFSPYELIFGNKSDTPSTITQKPEFKYTYEDYRDHLKYKLNRSFEIARENIIKSKNQSKKYYDHQIKETNYIVNDMVYVSDKSQKPGISKKLSPNYKGPFKIIKVNDNQTVTIKMNKKNVTYHKNLIKPYFSGQTESK